MTTPQTSAGPRSTATAASWLLLLAVIVSFSTAVSVFAGPVTSKQLLEATAAEERASQIKEINDVLQKFDKRDFDGALEQLKDVVKKNPELPPARLLLARLFVLTGQTAAGHATVEKAVDESPDDPEPYLMLGDLAFAGQRYVEADLLFTKAAELMPEFNGNEKRKPNLQTRVEAGLASVAEARQNWPSAKKHLEAWLKVTPDSPTAHYRLGIVLFRLDPKNIKAAREQLEIAAKGSDQIPSAAITLGRLYEQMGDRKQAETWMKYAIDHGAEDVKVRLGVARWQFELNRLDEARANVDAALKADPNSFEAQLMAGIVARYLRDFDAAEQHLEKAKQQGTDNAMATNQLALVLIENKDEAKRRRALELAEANIRNNQQNPEIAWTLGWIYFRSGRVNEAARILQSASAGGLVNADAAYYLAKVANDLGQADDVKRLLEAALSSKGPFAYRSEAQAWHDQLAAAKPK